MSRRTPKYRQDWHKLGDAQLVALRDAARQQADHYQSKGARLQADASMLDKLIRKRQAAAK